LFLSCRSSFCFAFSCVFIGEKYTSSGVCPLLYAVLQLLKAATDKAKSKNFAFMANDLKLINNEVTTFVQVLA